MDVDGRVAVVTGGGGGIGGALARRLVAGGAKVLVADLDGAGAAAVAAALPGGAALAVEADVSEEAAIEVMVSRAEACLGPVDLFFANAGIGGGAGLASEEEWEQTIEVNLLAHVRAARVMVPRWLGRGEGYFVATASAAGLLTQIGAAPYAVTKHAAVAFAEWLSVTYGARGIRASCLCPMGVDTALLNAGLDDPGEDGLAARVVAAAGDVLSPEEVAEDVIEAIRAERFLILPHPEVLEYFRRKGVDYDRWIEGMRRLQERVEGS
ncbi:MAG: SDR family oxidoreductase [Actinobacteria bacterium]|nr:SDR family oxidoreductase [Actinomycetota bacterium]